MSKEMSELTDTLIKEMIEDGGDRILIKTVMCNERGHEGTLGKCKGCESEMGCSKYVTCKIAMMSAAMIDTSDYEQMDKNAKYMMSKINGIIKAKTREEIQSYV